MSEAIQRLRDAFAENLLPPPSLLVSEWARERFQLSSEYSAARGGFQPYPFQVEPLDCLSPHHPSDTVALMCGAQMMKTLTALIFLAYAIDVDPGPFLIVQPTAPDAESFSKERIAPMLRDVPCVAAKVVESKSRDSGNTILQKRFLGGSVSLTGAVSARGLRRRSVRYLVLDEVDGYEITKDGDPISLAAARTAKFWNRKILLCSTPTIEGKSRIAKAYADSDQRKYFVPCPLCGYEQILVWGRVKWGKVGGSSIAPEAAEYICEKCDRLIAHHRKLEMLRAGRWVATNPSGSYPGFWISRLYAPDWSWGRIVTDPLEGFLASKENPATEQTFRNNVLAETYKEQSEAPDHEKLMARREDYRLGQVPDGVLRLTAGFDVQKTWLEGYIWGWGRNRHRWLIDHRRWDGDPFDQRAWDWMTGELFRTYQRISGGVMNIAKLAVDTGYATNEVYQWSRQYPELVVATDGRDRGELVGYPSLVDVTVAGRKIPNGAKIWPVNVSRCKSELYGLLGRERPKHGEPPPPGWIHFPADADEEFFLQLTAERLVMKIYRGYPKPYWEKDGSRRNEALDCHNMARAAASIDGFDRAADDDWDYLERKVAVVVPAPRAQQVSAPVVQPHLQPVAPAAVEPDGVVPSSFMRSFLG